MRSSMDLDAIRTYQRNFTQEREWEKYHTLKNLAISISLEANELLEVFQWLDDAESRAIAADERKMRAISDEVADILYYIIRFADVAKIDLEEAFWAKAERNEEKYPVSLSRGNAKKYNQF